jgi:long-subunit acyl-CoA synthetase (AMP-forming)
MKGYFQKEDLTSACIDSDGWLHTGDTGRFDEDGFLHVNGRIKDLIVLEDGTTLHPQEVESLLLSSTLVKDACVLAAKNPDTQANEVAVVIVPYKLDEHYLAAARKDIERICQTLDSSKKPARIAFSTRDLPHTHTGNLKRQDVARLLESDGAMIK